MGLSDIQSNRLAQSCIKFVQQHRLYILIYLIALVLDMLSTIYFMQFSGPHAEWHPVVRMASIYFGTTAGPIVGAGFKVMAALIVCAYWKKSARLLFAVASVVYLLAAWYNIFEQEHFVQSLIAFMSF